MTTDDYTTDTVNWPTEALQGSALAIALAALRRIEDGDDADVEEAPPGEDSDWICLGCDSREIARYARRQIEEIVERIAGGVPR